MGLVKGWVGMGGVEWGKVWWDWVGWGKDICGLSFFLSLLVRSYMSITPGSANLEILIK